METVIAQKRSGIIAGYIVCIVLGALLTMFGGSALAFIDREIIYLGYIMLICGLLVLAEGIAFTVIIARIPKNVITLKDNKLYFCNGVVCSPSEVENWSTSVWGLDAVVFGYGKLTVRVKGQDYKFRFVADINTVTAKLGQLKNQYILVENMQKQIAERNAKQQAAEAVESVKPATAADAAKNEEAEQPAEAELPAETQTEPSATEENNG